MLQSFKKFGLIALCISFLTSCITIEEDYDFKEDGSGKMSLKMDITQLLALMEIMNEGVDMEENENEENTNFRAEMQTLFSEQLKQLESISGVKDSKLWMNSDSSVFSLSYSFDNIKTLNKAYNTLMNGAENNEASQFSASKKNFKRNGDKAAIPGQGEISEDEKDMLTMLLSDSFKYNISYAFPTAIKVKQGSHGGLTKDSKIFTQNLEADDFLNNAESRDVHFKTKFKWK